MFNCIFSETGENQGKSPIIIIYSIWFPSSSAVAHLFFFFFRLLKTHIACGRTQTGEESKGFGLRAVDFETIFAQSICDHRTPPGGGEEERWDNSHANPSWI